MGKIYGGLLILENWKATKFGRMAMSESQVTASSHLATHILVRILAIYRQGHSTVVCMWFTYCITYIISIMYDIDKAADFLYSVLHRSVKIGVIIKNG